MVVRPVLRLGDPRLRLRSAELETADFGSARLMALVDDLRDTMSASAGAGLAAPQIGVPLRVVLYGIDANPRYPDAPPIPETLLVNPEITPIGEEFQLGWEGCLSVPGLRGEVRRWQHIRIAWCTAAGNPLEHIVSGFHARVVQHECDHLDGVLFPDRLSDPAAFGFIPELQAAGLIPALPG
jgi:peptide deformylase